MIDIYEFLSSSIKITSGKTISGDFTEENKQKLRKEDWRTYELIKNICSLVVNYHDNIADFQPGCRWEGKKSFAISDMTDDDYELLKE